MCGVVRVLHTVEVGMSKQANWRTLARRIRHVTRFNTSRTNGIVEILWENPHNNGVGQTSEMFLVVFGAN